MQGNAQAFAGTTLAFGNNAIRVTQNGVTAVNLSLGAITRGPGSVLSVTVPTAGTVNATSASIPNVNGIIGGWATVGTGATTTWAANDGAGNIVAFAPAGFTDVSGAAPVVANGPTTNVRLTGWTGNGTLAAAGVTTINSLAFVDTALRTLVFGAGNTLRVASGGILKTSTNNISLTLGSTTAGSADSTLTAGATIDTPAELVFTSNAPGSLSLLALGGSVLLRRRAARR